MFETILSWPIAVVLPTLWGIAMARSNATYWIGRGANSGYRRVRDVRRRITGRPSAVAFLHRFGPFAIVLCFLTIGVQTAVLATAGATRMPMRRFLPAVALGSAIWAVVYATIGLAVIEAWLLAAAGSWWAALILIVIVLTGAAALLLRRRRRTRQDGSGMSRSDGDALVTAAPLVAPARDWD